MEKSRTTEFKRIVIVAYRLPFTLKLRGSTLTAIQNTGGLVSAILSLTNRVKSPDGDAAMEKIVWVGKR